MPMTLELTPEQMEALRQAAFRYCAEADVEAALSRYPGKLGREDVFPNSFTLDTLTKSCLDKLSLENQYFPRSFMLRLIEQKWAAEPLRRGITTALPALIRPPRDLDAQIELLASTLDALADKIPSEPTRDDLGDARVFGSFCEARPTIVTIVSNLEQFERLKAIHDSLHTLQVLGAEWLDELAAERGDRASELSLLPYLAGVKTSAASSSDLPQDVADSCARCVAAVSDAESRIRSGQLDQIAFARASLRARLIEDLPVLNDALFALSRDFPLRQFYDLFSMLNLSDARDAALDLGDTLRRRIMEHVLWQATDRSLYKIERLLANPPGTLITDLTNLLPWMARDLRILLDVEADKQRVAAINDAVLAYAMESERSPDVASLQRSFDEICRAFANLRSCARTTFLEVDQALKRDFARATRLKVPLQKILDRVKPYCGLLMSPQ